MGKKINWYSTTKQVTIKNSTLLCGFYTLLQLLAVGSIFAYIIFANKGHNDTDTAIGAVLSKVKGVEFTNITGSDKYTRIWDTADFVVPPTENGAFFITTNAVITKGQRQGLCDEDPDLAPCQSDADCPVGDLPVSGNGMNTGRCINSTQMPGNLSCEIFAWCPVEDDTLPSSSSLFPHAVNFTVFIKSFATFPKFKMTVNSVQTESVSNTKCLYDKKSNPYCPIFRIGTILSEANVESFSDIAYKGGVILITINWNCHFAESSQNCKYDYDFVRMDNKVSTISPGWNFRYANYYETLNGTEYRTLIKAYGIKFIVLVDGTARKFSFPTLVKNLGVLGGIVSMAKLVFDFFILDLPLYKYGKWLLCCCRKPLNRYDYIEADNDAVPSCSNEYERINM